MFIKQIILVHRKKNHNTPKQKRISTNKNKELNKLKKIDMVRKSSWQNTKR